MDLDVTLVPYLGTLLACARLGGAVVGVADYDVADRCFTHVWTHPQARGRGVASAIYAFVESTGRTVVPSATLTEAGMAFWRARGVDPSHGGSRLVVGGRCADDDVHGRHDVSAEVAEWDGAGIGAGPRH